MSENKRVLSIDLETYSDVDLGNCGVYRYVEGDFHILLFAYAFDDEEVRIVDMAQGEQIPQEVVDAIHDDSIIKAAWNAAFERTCLSKYFGKRLPPDSWQCSMVWAASLSLPLALKNAAAVLKTGEQKDKAGEALIKYFSVPCKPTKTNGGRTRNLPEHAPEDWQRFKDYCLQDVRTERDIRHRLENFPLPDSEWDYYHMDQRINDRGVLIDRELVTQAITCDLLMTEEMTKRAYELTGLENPNSVSQLKGWLTERGIEVDSLGKKNVAALIHDLDKNSIDGEAQEMIPYRGEVWFADLGYHHGTSVQDGCRPVLIVSNDKGKGYPANRVLADEEGNPYDILVGTFYICGLTRDDFASISDELAEKYTEKFRYPEAFMRTENGHVVMFRPGSGEPPVRLF